MAEQLVSQTEMSIQYLTPPPSIHCNQLVVQATDRMYLHFYQIRPVFAVNPEQPIDSIAEPVASLAIDFDRAQEFINVMQRQLNALKAMASGIQAESPLADEVGALRTDKSSRFSDADFEARSAITTMALAMTETTISPEGSRAMDAAIANKTAKLKITPRALPAK